LLMTDTEKAKERGLRGLERLASNPMVQNLTMEMMETLEEM